MKIRNYFLIAVGGALLGLGEELAALGLELRRYKTGTPPRLHRHSIDYQRLEVQPGDEIFHHRRGEGNRDAAAVRQAELNLEFTQVRAPVDGFVTNLNLRLGSQAVANQPTLALVDVNSFWICGFFKETAIGKIGEGVKAVVTLMAYPDTPLEGYVDSIGWGIAQQDGSTGFELLPTISPTFEWIRLAQRVPVRIHLTNVPKEVKLRVGTTCSVLVMTGTAGSEKEKRLVAVPRALQ